MAIGFLILLLALKLKNMKKKVNKTVTINGMMAVTKSESGLDYVQVLPDNPSVGLVKPFSAIGRGQLLSNGTFDFIRKKRRRNKPELRLKFSTLSYGPDGWDRFLVMTPTEMRDELPAILAEDSADAVKYLREQLKKGKKA